MLKFTRQSLKDPSVIEQFIEQSKIFYSSGDRVSNYEYIWWKYYLCPMDVYLVTLLYHEKQIFRFVQILDSNMDAESIFQIQDFLCLDTKYSFLAFFAIINFNVDGKHVFHVSNELSDPLYSKMNYAIEKKLHVCFNLLSFISWPLMQTLRLLTRVRILSDLSSLPSGIDRWIKWQKDCPNSSLDVFASEKGCYVVKNFFYKLLPISIVMKTIDVEIESWQHKSKFPFVFYMTSLPVSNWSWIKVPNFLLPHETTVYSTTKRTPFIEFGNLDYF